VPVTVDAHVQLCLIWSMGEKANLKHEIEVELESHELAAVRRLRYTSTTS
jgi:hypothetical protein